MLKFMLITAFAVFFSISFTKILHILIQPGQLLGDLFWQKMLDRLDRSKYPIAKSLAKPLGDCELCFSHLCQLISFIIYAILSCLVFHVWVTDFILQTGWFLKALVNFCWYIFFVFSGTWAGLIVLLFKLKKPKIS